MNEKYEYKTIEFPWDPETFNYPPNAPSENDGWSRMWADITQYGCFVVYRREK